MHLLFEIFGKILSLLQLSTFRQFELSMCLSLNVLNSISNIAITLLNLSLSSKLEQVFAWGPKIFLECQSHPMCKLGVCQT